MIAYLDSSALVKRYVQERGSAAVDRWFASAELLCTAKLAYPEVLAGLARKLREGGMTRANHRKAREHFLKEWEALTVAELTDGVLAGCRRLLESHPLRGADAVHLATALQLQRSLQEEVAFICADVRLLKAAAAERLTPLNPEDEDEDED